MAIHFKLDDDPATLGFALSPLTEAVASLHVLLYPKVHALQHPWVRSMRRLSVALKRELAALSFLYEDAFPDCLAPQVHDRTETMDEALARVQALKVDECAHEFGRPLYFYREADAGGPERLADGVLRRQIVEYAWRVGGEDAAVTARLAWDDPAALRDRLVAAVERYWDEAFGEEWARLEPLLEDAVEEGRATVEHAGPIALFGGLGEIVVDIAARSLTRRSPHEHEVRPTRERRLLCVPSAYVWPHSRVNCDEPWPLIVMYPAPFVVREAARQPVPPELVRTLRAVGDTTRLRVLRLISDRPRSTEELAPLVALSEPALSRQLRLLVDARLVRARRQGYYVLYELEPDGLSDLPAALEGYLGGAATGRGSAPA